jgi:hypothetical protein
LATGVTRSDALKAVRGDFQPTDSEKEEALSNAAAITVAVEAKGRQDFFLLRNKWSNWIIGWITSLIIFNCVLAFLVGLSWLDFSQYKWFITAVTVETFLQIVGMGYIAVRFLFSHYEGGSSSRTKAKDKSAKTHRPQMDDASE